MSKELSHAEQVAKYERETEVYPGITIAKVRYHINELRTFNHNDTASVLGRVCERLMERLDYAEVKQSRNEWKNAWAGQHEATGRVAWKIPIFYYMKEVPIDPRNFEYMAKIDKMIVGFLRVIEIGMKAYNAKKKSDDDFKARWNFAATEKTMEFYRKRNETKA